MDLPLLDWLQTYTFPCEARFADLEFARIAYEKSVRRHLKYGTTFASYFATIHNSAAKVLVDVVATLGQRAHVGKVSMDRNSPPFYIEETDAGCDEVEDFARHVLSLTKAGRQFLTSVDGKDPIAPSSAKNEQGDLFPFSLQQTDTLLNKVYAPLVMPCVTPRFVPTCSEKMMQRLGEISRKYGLPVQSHLSESPGEIAWVASLHPDCETYADVYRKYGLLHAGSYMAHCCHSGLEERQILKAHNTGVVHCASSNFMLSSGVMDVRRFVTEGIKVAIGTDVAGGYSPSMLDAIRQSFVASKCKDIAHQDDLRRCEAAALEVANRRQATSIGDNNESSSNNRNDNNIKETSHEMHKPLDPLTDGTSISDQDEAAAEEISTASSVLAARYKSLTYKEVFYLATQGGADVLGMGDVVGNFKVGKKLDCLVVDIMKQDGPIDTFGKEDLLEKFQKFLFLGDDRNIVSVYVDGRKVI